MAPHSIKNPSSLADITPATPVSAEDQPITRGPHPGHISISDQYTFEQKIRRMQRENGCDPAREDSYRLQGIQLIDNVREALQLPVKTFDTACTYYHKFRLCFRDAEYSYQDAAMASLFVACKVEDTIKKSKEILCAAYNLKNPDKPTTPDDKVLEQPHRIIIGLERLVLETIGFDFRVRYPQKLLAKVVRRFLAENENEGDEQARWDFYATAYDMCIDIYKTFAPIKQTTFTMVMTILELTARVTDLHVDKVQGIDPDRWHTNRACVVETMLDLLDLYTQNPKSTKVGVTFDLARFIDIKIQVNQEVDSSSSGRQRLSRFQPWCDRCEADDRDAAPVHPITPGSATSPATTGSNPGSGSMKRANGRGQDGTMRFVFDVEQARAEQDTVGSYFRDEFEEYEIEVEEPVPESRHGGHDHHGHGHGNGGRSDKGHGYRNNGQEGGWAPYHRNRHGHHHDRHKGRKGGGGYY